MSVPVGTPVELPPYRALLVVDMKDFSGTESREHAGLTEEIPRILRRAFVRADLGDVWDEQRFSRTTGDGYALGFSSSALPFLLHPLLGALQHELEGVNRNRSADSAPVRMRVSVNVGPVTDSGENAVDDGSGAARVEVHRLLDAPAVVGLLARSDDATCVAAIVSTRAVQDAVFSGCSGESHGLYVPVDVQVKKYRAVAYLRVPHPTGDLLQRGFRTGDRDRSEENSVLEPVAQADGNTMGSVQAGGDVAQARDHRDHRRTGVGTVHGDVGTVVTEAHGPMHTGTGNQVNGPQPGRRGRPRAGR